jgi:nucleoside-diphosphate-sugar epimerase
MKILVTSGNGYVGRELFRQLSDQHEYPILAADNVWIQSIFGWRGGIRSLTRSRIFGAIQISSKV